MTTFANATETLAHMELMYSVYGETLLLVWKTAESKIIDVCVLWQLAKQGVIRMTPSSNMYGSDRFYFIP